MISKYSIQNNMVEESSVRRQTSNRRCKRGFLP